MSERFVRGWKVSPQKLNGLVGAKRLTARDILASKANSKCLQDVLMTLGDGDEDEGRQAAGSALTAILGGPLDSAQAYEYARVMEIILNHVGRPLATKYKAGFREPTDQILLQLTYHVPNDSHGRWNPLLKACKLATLAKSWAALNVSFPWGPAGQRPKVGWPVWTVFDEDVLPEITEELEQLTRECLDAMSDKILADNKVHAAACREEFWSGLKRLQAWVRSARAPEKAEGLGWAKQGNALMLLMDGDQ
jgi:hypothetical protein